MNGVRGKLMKKNGYKYSFRRMKIELNEMFL